MAVNTFQLSPEQLTGKTTEAEINISYMTATDFQSQTGTSFSLEELTEQFQRLCPDYDNLVEIDTPSQAVDFCKKVIYDIAPRARQIKTRDVTFKLNFLKKDKEVGGKLVSQGTRGVMNIITQKMDTSRSLGQNVMTVKKASLLATKTFNAIAVAVHAANAEDLLLTPLSAAVFDRTVVKTMAEVHRISPIDCVRIINASTCNGGHLLADSDANYAIAAALCATSGANDTIKKSVVSQVVKQYAAKDKMNNVSSAKIGQVVRFCNGGVPEGFDIETLTQTWNDGRAVARRDALKLQEARLLKVQTPDTVAGGSKGE